MTGAPAISNTKFKSIFTTQLLRKIKDIMETNFEAIMEKSQTWYIIKRPQGSCDIVPAEQIEKKEDPNIGESWGPYTSLDEAIARRVGLIRAGKCQPQ